MSAICLAVCGHFFMSFVEYYVLKLLYLQCVYLLKLHQLLCQLKQKEIEYRIVLNRGAESEGTTSRRLLFRSQI